MDEKRLSIEFFREMKPEKTISGKDFKDYSYLCYVALYLFAAEYCRKKVVLDGACGMGFGSFMLGQIAERVIGIDIDSSSLAYAGKRYPRQNLSFLFSDVTQTPFRHPVFDAIVSIETFEHLRPEQALSCLHEFERLLKPEGTLVISTPNRSIHRQISKNPDHRNEMEVGDFFDLLSSIFPSVVPFYQRKGVLQSMRGFYRIIKSDRFKIRKLVPECIKDKMRKRVASQLEADYPELFEQLKVHPASSLDEIQDAVIQVAVCRKK